MVKSILISMMVLSFTPILAQAKPGRGKGFQQPPKMEQGGGQFEDLGSDQELNDMEDLLDQEADQAMSRRGHQSGISEEEIIGGIIGIIGDLASRNERGRGGHPRHPGFGRQYRKVMCVARNGRGMRFRADGYVERRVARRALKTCQWNSRFPRSCQVVCCRRAH